MHRGNVQNNAIPELQRIRGSLPPAIYMQYRQRLVWYNTSIQNKSRRYLAMTIQYSSLFLCSTISLTRGTCNPSLPAVGGNLHVTSVKTSYAAVQLNKPVSGSVAGWNRARLRTPLARVRSSQSAVTFVKSLCVNA